MKMLIGGAAAALALASVPAGAEVTDKSAAGFEVVQRVTIAAAPTKVYAAVMAPGGWWSSDHTFSHDAKNLSVDLAAGCFCEKMPHGAIRFMNVVYADGATTLRMFGGLGPMLFTGAAGNLSYVAKANGDKTDLTLTYDVGGYAKGGLAETLAAPVDAVLGQQLARLKRYVESGRPEPTVDP